MQQMQQQQGAAFPIFSVSQFPPSKAALLCDSASLLSAMLQNLFYY
jgi:hypothetical protein